MELSRRGMLGGFAAVGAVGVGGFAGAAAVTSADGAGTDGGGEDNEADGGGEDTEADGGGEDNEADGGGDAAGSVPVDPDAPFEARLLDPTDDGGDEGLRLFDASDLERVQGPVSEDGEHRVYVALGDAGIDAFQTRLDDAGAADDPSGFVVSMTLDDREVRRVELDESTVAALTDTEWGGVLTLPFDDEAVAVEVYESLAESSVTHD